MPTIEEIRTKVMGAGFSGETLTQVLEILDSAAASSGELIQADMDKIVVLTEAEMDISEQVANANDQMAGAYQDVLDLLSSESDTMVAEQVDSENRFNSITASK